MNLPLGFLLIKTFQNDVSVDKMTENLNAVFNLKFRFKMSLLHHNTNFRRLLSFGLTNCFQQPCSLNGCYLKISCLQELEVFMSKEVVEGGGYLVLARQGTTLHELKVTTDLSRDEMKAMIQTLMQR